MSQSTRLASFSNTISLTLQVSMDVFEGSAQLASFRSSSGPPAFVISGMTGAVVSNSEVELLRQSGITPPGVDASERFCSPATGGAGRAEWSQVAHELKLTLCNGATLWSGEEYVLAFNVLNPASQQESPPISIELVGGTSWSRVAIEKPGTWLDPLLVCNLPECELGLYPTDCTTCASCPMKSCPRQALVLDSCNADSGGSCVDCATFNASWVGSACICLPNYFGDGRTCSACPQGTRSVVGSTDLNQCRLTPIDGYKVTMTLRVSGAEATFDGVAFAAAIVMASPTAFYVTVLSFVDVVVSRRRLLGTHVDVVVEIVYGNLAAAEEAKASDLTQSSLSSAFLASTLGTVEVIQEAHIQPLETVVSTTLVAPTTTPMPDPLITPWLELSVGMGSAAALCVVLIAWLWKRGSGVLSPSEATALRMSAKASEPDIEINDKFFENGELKTGKRQTAVHGLAHHMGVQPEDLLHKASLGLNGIKEEVEAFVANASTYAPLFLKARAQNSIESDNEYREAFHKEVERIMNVKWLLNYILEPEGIPVDQKRRRFSNGVIDQGRPVGMTMKDFVELHEAREAKLSKVEVVALRMYTTAAFRYMNEPLRIKGAASESPIASLPLPVLTYWATEGIRKLRALHDPEEVSKEEGDHKLDNHEVAVANSHMTEKVLPGRDTTRLEDEVRPEAGESPSLTVRPKAGNTPLPTPFSLSGGPLPQLPPMPNRISPEIDWPAMISSEKLGVKRDQDRENGNSPPATPTRVAWSDSEEVSPVQVEETIAPVKTDLMKRKLPTVLWRGMKGMVADKNFMQQGGTEMAFMSTTTDLSVAVRYSLSANSLIFKIRPRGFMGTGADLQWVSAFPNESEYCYPPLTYLRPLRRTVMKVKVKSNSQNDNQVPSKPGNHDTQDGKGSLWDRMFCWNFLKHPKRVGMEFTVVEVEPQMS